MPQSIQCLTPHHYYYIINNVTIYITNNLQDIQTSNFTFQYVSDINITSIIPLDMLYRGSIINIYGSEFINIDTLSCKFIDYNNNNIATIVSALYISNQHITCIIPQGINNNHQATDILLVETSNNGVDYTNYMLNITLANIPQISYIYPQYGPIEGGTYISIYGEFFQSTSWMACKFTDNNNITIPIYINRYDIVYICILYTTLHIYHTYTLYNNYYTIHIYHTYVSLSRPCPCAALARTFM